MLEPRVVSKHIGIHPIFTLIAMHTGFKAIGVLGIVYRTYSINNIKKYICKYN